jgi:glutamate racemase
MDNRPIGFFDSGLGGLTCIPSLMKALPRERIVYFGDTARTPYGSKAATTIRHFAIEITDFLVHNNVKMVVIACNTVSATCLEELRRRRPELPILGIISPACRKVATQCGEENHIGIIGTKATIRSGAYREKLLALNPSLDIYEAACPAFVPLIEEGIIENEIMDLTIRHYLDHFISYHKIDSLVLGCTHYPLIRKNITKLYPALSITNPSEEVLSNIEKRLATGGLFAEEAVGDHVFYASDLSENFVNMINRIFQNTDYKVAFKNFDLETRHS